MRAPTLFALAAVACFAACGDPNLAPSGAGTLSVAVNGAAQTALDSGQVLLRGAAERTIRATPGQGVTIDGLLPGTYTVSLRGFAGDGIDHFGRTTAEVVAGQSTAATVNFASLVSTVTPLLPTTSKSFTVDFAAVPGVTDYRVEAARDAAFTTGLVIVPATTTPANVTATVFGRHYVRVRALDPYQGMGRSTVSQIIQIADVNQAFEPATFTLFAGGTTEKAQTFTVNATGTLTHLDIYVVFASADVLFDVRATTGGVPNESNTVTLYSETIPQARFTTSTYYRFPLGPNGIPVVAGQVLAFTMRSTASFQWNGRNDNSYPSGVWYYRGGGGPGVWTVSDASFDMAFRAYVSPN